MRVWRNACRHILVWSHMWVLSKCVGRRQVCECGKCATHVEPLHVSQGTHMWVGLRGGGGGGSAPGGRGGGHGGGVSVCAGVAQVGADAISFVWVGM
jgi:hypothetical protein